MATEKGVEVYRSQYRLPKPMADWLKAQATAHYRSVNAELIEIIRDAMERSRSSGAQHP